VEADEICVEATAPVRTRTATKARTMFFMDWAPFYMIVSKLQKISYFSSECQCLDLPAKTHTAGVRIVWSTCRDWENADAGCGDFVLGGRGRDLRGGDCTGEDEDGDEGADDMFHSGIPLKLYLLKKISLDNQMR
jgi:hypothetical protein